MAAATGPMPGLAQKQRLKYDPIALRQPREPELSGWRKFLNFFVHPSVRQVDRRDRWWGLIVWFLVVVVYGGYLFVLIHSRLKQRQHPPVSVQILNLALPGDKPDKTKWTLNITTTRKWMKDPEVPLSGEGPAVYSPVPVEKFPGIIQARLMLTNAFEPAPDDVGGPWAMLHIRLSHRDNTRDSNTTLNGTRVVGQLWVSHSCVREFTQDSGNCTDKKVGEIYISHSMQMFEIHQVPSVRTIQFPWELHKYIRLPKKWDPSWTNTPEDSYAHRESWSYRLSQYSGFNVRSVEEHEALYEAYLYLQLPIEVITYKEHEPFDVLTMFGVAPATWGSFVVVITLLLPLRSSGRRRVWPCCWRLSARVLQQENKEWDAKRKNSIQHEMEGDIQEEMGEVENQPICNIAVLELPSMEDRMARTERVLRRLMNRSHPRKLKLRRLYQQRRQHKALPQKGRFAHDSAYASDEGNESRSDVEGRGGGRGWEVEQ